MHYYLIAETLRHKDTSWAHTLDCPASTHAGLQPEPSHCTWCLASYTVHY